MGRIATTDELIAYLGLKVPERVNGELLGNMLSGAEQFAATYTGRLLWPDPPLAGTPPADTAAPATRTITVRPGSRYVRVPDVRSIVSLSLDGGVLAAGMGYDMADTYQEPATHIKLLNYSPYMQNWRPSNWSQYAYSTMVITGRFGFYPAPADIKDAVLALAARRYRERDAAWSDAVQTQEGAVFNYFRELPSSIAQILNMYRAPNVGMISEPSRSAIGRTSSSLRF